MFTGFNSIVHSVVGDVPIDSEVLVVTSSISIEDLPVQSLKILIWGRIRVRML